MPHANYRHKGLVIGNSIYVVAGCLTNKTQMYDISTNKWVIKCAIPGSLECGAAVALKGIIYLLGGLEHKCMSYDPKQDMWTHICMLPKRWRSPLAVSWEGKIVLMGDTSNKTDLKMSEYDPVTNKWAVLKAPLLYGHYCMLTVPHTITQS